jgi:hypothetical protein
MHIVHLSNKIILELHRDRNALPVRSNGFFLREFNYAV